METPLESALGNETSEGKTGGPEIGTGPRSPARLELSGHAADGMENSEPRLRERFTEVKLL
jgi:hypothetical protein